MNTHSKGQFSDYLDHLIGQGHYWFTKKRLQQNLGLSDNAMKVALWRASQKSLVCRIRGEFYVIVTPEYRSAGCLPARWFINPLMEYLELPYYVGLLSAASLYGSAHQQVMRLQVVTNQQMRPITAGNQYIQFLFKRELSEQFLESKKTPLSYLKVSNPNLTLVDLVKYANGEGQLQLAATVIYELLEEISVENLVLLAKDKQISLPTVQRLGYLLDNVMQSKLDLSPLAMAVDQRHPRYIPLVGDKDDAEYVKNPCWHILIDAQLELDEL